MKKIEISIEGMTCGGCAKRGEESLSEIDGAKNILVSLKENKAFLEVPEEISENLLKHKINETGYKAVKVKIK